jgi:hypothetical protein
MSGPADAIIVGHTYHHAYECDVECVEYAEVLVEFEALIVDLENLIVEFPNPKRHADGFETAEVMKTIPLDPSGFGEKTLRISFELDPK